MRCSGGKPSGGDVLRPVRDELIAMVPEFDGAAATEALTACMTTQFMGAPIKAKASQPNCYRADAAKAHNSAVLYAQRMFVPR